MANDPKVAIDVKAAMALAAALTAIALLIGDSSIGVIVTLLVLLLVVFAMFRSPVRHTMMVLMFFALILPNPAEGRPSDWIPPLTTVGAILLNHLNTVDRSIGAFSSLSINGIDVLFLILGLIIVSRRGSGAKIDSAGRSPVPKPLKTLALVSVGTAIFTWLSGMARGGDFGMSLWQINNVIYLPLVFLLFDAGLRGPADHRALAKTLLGAATYKCLLAMFVYAAVSLPPDPETGNTHPAYATSHNDSMLFSAAFVLVLASLIEDWGKRSRKLAFLFLPILIGGTIANNRRLAWVQVALVFLTVYLVSRETRMKRKIRRTLFASVPFIVVYLMAGWDSQYGKTFKVARMVRSIVDAKSDGSSQWRELENVNLIATFRGNTVLGTGFGHPYEEIVKLPAVDYSLERYTPHNSLLGMWTYTGLVGYAGITLLWMAGVYFAMRAYYTATNAQHRVAALVSFGAVLVYMCQAWGDLGLGSWTGVFLMGSGLAVGGKLAVANGQWGPSQKRSPSAAPHAEVA